MKIEQEHPMAPMHVYDIDAEVADKIRQLDNVLQVTYEFIGHYTIDLIDENQAEVTKQQIRGLQ